MIWHEVYKKVAERADLRREGDLDLLWMVVTELVSPSTIASTERIERSVSKCYSARTKLVRELTERERAAAYPARPSDESDNPSVSRPLNLKRQEDLVPLHLEPYGQRSARQLAVELGIPENWIIDLRRRMSLRRKSERKRLATVQRNSSNASVC